MKKRPLILAAALATLSISAGADPNATGQLIVDTIKNECRREFPKDEAEFLNCATKRYDAMRAFHEKLFRYRDTKGINSAEFQKGIACVDSASPSAQEPGRKKAVERADWLKANECYEAALR